MPESVLEASWREKRHVSILYNQASKNGVSVLKATGYIATLSLEAIQFRADGGFDFSLPVSEVVRIDGRAPLSDDKPSAPEPSLERVVFYCSGNPANPNEVLTVEGTLWELSNGTLRVDTADDRQFLIPRHYVVRIENPGPSVQPYPNKPRIPGMRK